MSPGPTSIFPSCMSLGWTNRMSSSIPSSFRRAAQTRPSKSERVTRRWRTAGVVTAVAGRTELLLDQRHLDAGELAAMLKEADEACHKAAEEFGCTVEVKHLWSIPPIPFDDRLIGFAKEALGSDTAIPSGPLHDAAEMARLIPTVMVFSKSSPPVSHTPEEDTPEADLKVAIEVYGKTVAATLAAAAEGDLPPMG